MTRARIGMVLLALAMLAGVGLLRRASVNPVVRAIPLGKGPVALPLLLDTQTHRAFVVNSGSNSVSVLDTRTGRLVRTVGVGPSPGGGPRGMAAVAVHAGRVFVINGGKLVSASGHSCPARRARSRVR